MKDPIQILADLIERQETAVLATVIEVQGASPAKVCSQMMLCSDGSTVGTVGGGKLEEAILTDAKQALETGEAQIRHYKLAETGPDAIGTLCGGEVRVFFHPYSPHPRLVIVGGGHIGRPLKVMGEAAGFNVIIVDVQPGRADIPSLEQLDFQREAYVVLITTDHISDEVALRYVLTTPAQYVGMIGSRAKCRKIVDRLQVDGYTEETLHRVYAPIGLDLGGSTPEEIAVAILAEIIAVRRGKLGQREVQISARKIPFIHSAVEEKIPAMETDVNHEN